MSLAPFLVDSITNTAGFKFSTRTGISVWEQSGGRVGNPGFKPVLAEGMAQAGDLAGALLLVNEVIAQIERPGWEERHYYAEALRIKAWLLTLKGDAEGAERAYIASLVISEALRVLPETERFEPVRDLLGH